MHFAKKQPWFARDIQNHSYEGEDWRVFAFGKYFQNKFDFVVVVLFNKKNIVGIHFDFILPETFFGHIIHSVNDPAVLTHSGKYQ